MVNDERTLWNSKLWFGIILMIAGFLFSFMFYMVDDFLYDVFAIDLYSMGYAAYYFFAEGIPAILMIIGFAILIYGIYIAYKK